jgi:hypothetical protein
MTKGQLRRTIPGFIRVELLLDESTGKYPAQLNTGPVPIDLLFTDNDNNSQQQQYYQEVNSTICCSVSSTSSNANRPQIVTPSQ